MVFFWIAAKQRFFFIAARKSKKTRVFLTWWLKFPENKWFLNHCRKVQEKQMVLWPDDWNSQTTKGFFDWLQKNNGAPNPGIYSIFSALEPQILEVTALSVHSKPQIWNLQTFSAGEDHIQESAASTALFSGHWRPRESKPSEEVPSHFFLQSGKWPFWAFFRSRAAGFGVIISRKNWIGN